VLDITIRKQTQIT